MTKVVWIIVGLFLLYSCKKSTSVIEKETNTILLKKIVRDVHNSTAYEYNSNGLLTKLIVEQLDGFGNVNTYSQRFVYDQNRLTQMQTQSGFTNYEYLNGKLQSTKNYKQNGEALSTTQFEFNSNNQLITSTETVAHVEPGNISATKNTYDYNTQGNLRKVAFYLQYSVNSPFKLIDSTVYEQYDTFKNVEPSFQAGLYIPNIIFQKNNPTRIVFYNEKGNIEGINSCTHIYNPNGYPAKRTILNSNSSQPFVFSFQYK